MAKTKPKTKPHRHGYWRFIRRKKPKKPRLSKTGVPLAPVGETPGLNATVKLFPSGLAPYKPLGKKVTGYELVGVKANDPFCMLRLYCYDLPTGQTAYAELVSLGKGNGKVSHTHMGTAIMIALAKCGVFVARKYDLSRPDCQEDVVAMLKAIGRSQKFKKIHVSVFKP